MMSSSPLNVTKQMDDNIETVSGSPPNIVSNYCIFIYF